MLRCLLFVMMTFMSQVVLSQGTISGSLYDAGDGSPINFAVVANISQNISVYTDVDGTFVLKAEPTDSIAFIHINYQTWKTLASEVGEKTELEPKSVVLGEINIKPGINSAEKIMQKVIDNKPYNNPESYFSFSFESYNKMWVTLKLDSAILGDNAAYALMPESSKNTAKRMEEHYLMLVESTSERKFSPPNLSLETITATRVSGMQNPQFALLATELQSFSFYSGEIEIWGEKYVSPLNDNAINKYLFILEDSVHTDIDTVYTISYRPRMGTTFTGMKGIMNISSNGYAIKNVDAEPVNSERSLEVKIKQQYALIYGHWFPEQLSSFFLMPGLDLNGWPYYGEARSYIHSVQTDMTYNRSDFSNVTMQMLPDATQKDEGYWEAKRVKPLELKERLTYVKVDSIGQKVGMDQMVENMMSFTSGKLPIGKFNVDLTRVLGFNNYEGVRLGAGLETNDRLSKYGSLAGYYAYGFKDRQHKYGSEAKVNFSRARQGFVKLSYSNDVEELGGRMFTLEYAALDPSRYYQLFISRMDRVERGQVEVNGRAYRNITLNAFANRQHIQSDVDFYTPYADNVTIVENDFYVSEVGLKVRWAPFERLAKMGDREIRLNGRWPVFHAKYSQGMNLFEFGDWNYQRWDAMIEKTFRFLYAGQLKVQIQAGMIKGEVPLSLMYNARGSWKSFSIATPFAFETMRTNEFQHSEFVAVFIRHNLKDILFSRPLFKPHVVLVHSSTLGVLNHPQRFGTSAKSVTLGYHESGIQIDRLIKSGWSYLGVGVFYRYGPYHLEKWSDNIAIKLSASFGG